MHEKNLPLEGEIEDIKRQLGEHSIITETDEGIVVKTKMETDPDDGIEGNQEVEIVLGAREKIPMDLSEWGYEFTGLPMRSLKINGKEIEGFNIYISPMNQEGNSIIGANFADAESNSAVVTSFKTGADILRLSHELGHIKANHTIKNRRAPVEEMQEKVLDKYTNYETITVDTEGIKNDPEAVRILKEIYLLEVAANEKAHEVTKELGEGLYPNDPGLVKAHEWLDKEVKRQYLTDYGVELE